MIGAEQDPGMETEAEVHMNTEQLVIDTTQTESGIKEHEGEDGVESEDVAMLELVDQMEIEISDHEGEEEGAESRTEDSSEEKEKRPGKEARRGQNERETMLVG